MLARKNHQYRITGVDLSESCLRIGGKKAAAAGVGDHIEFICAGAEDIPLEPGSVNLVVSTCSLHHWRYPVCILRKVSGLLADKGEIWIMDDWQDASHEDRKKWVELVEGIAGAGILFKCVFWFESRYLAYFHRKGFSFSSGSGCIPDQKDHSDSLPSPRKDSGSWGSGI